VEDLPVPSVTAINGIALGGGFEMALSTDYRVMSTAAQVGFRKSSSAIYPGFGGTVRLPRPGPRRLRSSRSAGAAEPTSDQSTRHAVHRPTHCTPPPCSAHGAGQPKAKSNDWQKRDPKKKGP